MLSAFMPFSLLQTEVAISKLDRLSTHYRIYRGELYGHPLEYHDKLLHGVRTDKTLIALADGQALRGLLLLCDNGVLLVARALWLALQC